MTDNPYSEASKHHTAWRRELKRHQEAKDRELSNHEARLLELRQALSPAAARIVAAAEQDDPEPRCADGTLIVEANDVGKYIDPNPAPAWLNESPPPATGIVEVEHKPKARRA